MVFIRDGAGPTEARSSVTMGELAIDQKSEGP